MLPAMTNDRRSFVGLLLAGALTPFASACGREATAKESFPFSLSETQWRKRLTQAEYRVLREEGTERAYSSPLNEEKRSGTYACAGCGNHAFSSRTKFESGTGWPSFYRPLKGGVGTSTDYKLGYPRTEVHCARCGGHLGHVFDDGPAPTGKRYCMNGVALDFIPGPA